MEIVEEVQRGSFYRYIDFFIVWFIDARRIAVLCLIRFGPQTSWLRMGRTCTCGLLIPFVAFQIVQSAAGTPLTYVLKVYVSICLFLIFGVRSLYLVSYLILCVCCHIGWLFFFLWRVLIFLRNIIGHDYCFSGGVIFHPTICRSSWSSWRSYVLMCQLFNSR